MNSRNGYRHRELDTRAGTIDVAVPKLRSGTYFPEWLLERRKRAEAALISVVATCYLLGVSTRRMDKLVQSLGIDGLSKSQVSRMAADLDEQVAAFRTRPLGESGPFVFVAADALTMKVREHGRVVNAVVLVATGVNSDGHREVLEVKVATSETKEAWNTFFADLVARGLAGVKLVVSDAHAGLVEAIAANLPGAAWQRCRTHYAANLMSVCPKTAWPAVKALLHSVYDQPDAGAVHARWTSCSLTDPTGAPLRITPHQLRHTYATELANAGMSLQALMALLGHVTSELTIRYAHLAPATLNTAYENAVAGLRPALPIAAPTRPIIPDTIAWLNTEMIKTRLGLGYCARHHAAGPCDYANICEICDNFTTSPDFAPALISQLADIRALHADAEQRGWADEAQRHQRSATALEEHLRQLQPR